eukprot:TRINITY_DN13964_c0_g1_i2.p1 TRINITY_DN13964_c0_g1~~TRINITY_DN13964_c0_g1_i2.p1  ORF type:complete len:398 (+),score=85.05 TRINITY_DN13964_c0_g1_i2:201-1394(+)
MSGLSRLVLAVGLTVAMGAPRVIPLFHGHHFDDLMNDCTHECPPVLLGFYTSQCAADFSRLRFSAGMPPREELFMGTYNVSSAKSVWFEHTQGTNLATRFGVDLSETCPQLLYVPHKEWQQKHVFAPGKTDQKWQAWVSEQMRDWKVHVKAVPVKERTVHRRELASRDQDSSFRWSAIMRQAPQLPGYTKLGFKLVEMPEEVSTLVNSFYERHRSNVNTEGFYAGYTTINFREIPTTMVDLNKEPHTKRRIAEALRPVVEAWVGQKLTMTSLYGIREYHKGSWLKLHTDHVSSHVFSLIINVAQEGMVAGEDWPVEVFSFDGSRMNVTMKPGQMLLYESAKLVHGRPSVLTGSKYVNCFAHYKPVDDANWDFFHTHDVVQSKSKGEIVDLKLYDDEL